MPMESCLSLLLICVAILSQNPPLPHIMALMVGKGMMDSREIVWHKLKINELSSIYVR